MEIPEYTAEINGSYEVTISPETCQDLDSIQTGESTYHVIHDRQGYAFKLLNFDPDQKIFQWMCSGRIVHVRLRNPVESLVHSMGLENVEHDKVRAVAAPMPGLVLDIKVKKGDQVKRDETLVILEAMKMENVIAAPNDGEINEILVNIGDKVEKEQTLLNLD